MLLRDPASVPAPVAIALADFCRRADRPSSAEEVRQALARLSPDEDRAVEALCRGEPPARPLSPHAVIDLVRGLPAAEAARREEAGSYAAIAAEAAAEAGEPLPPVRRETAEVEAPTEVIPVAENPFAPDAASQAARIREAVQAAAGDLEKAADELGFEDGAALRRFAAKLGATEATAPQAPRTTAQAEKPRRKKKETVVGPLRRTRAEVEAMRAARAAEAEPEEEPLIAPRPGRNPAQPQFGRYVAGRPVRRPFSELESSDGAGVLEELVAELRGNRRHIVARLDTLYARPDGRPVSEGDFERLLARHRLTAWFGKVEVENLKILLRQSRGFLPPVSRALQLEPRELKALIRKHNLESDIRELKERTREDARAERPLAERILLAAEKDEQLRDAGVLDEVDQRNLAELRPAIEAQVERGESRDPLVVAELARRAMEIEPRVWRRAMRRYRLAYLAAELLGVPPPEEPAAAARESGKRMAPSRANLPVRQRSAAPRREVLVSRIGAPTEGGERPPRRFAGAGVAPRRDLPRPLAGDGTQGGFRPPRKRMNRPVEGAPRPAGRPFGERPAKDRRAGDRRGRPFGGPRGGGEPPVRGGARPFGNGRGRPGRGPARPAPRGGPGGKNRS